MNKGKLREVLRDIQTLTAQHCHLEARIKLAVAINRYQEAKILMCLDHICSLERNTPRDVMRFRDVITQRLLRYAGETEGPQTVDKLLKALTIKQD